MCAHARTDSCGVRVASVGCVWPVAPRDYGVLYYRFRCRSLIITPLAATFLSWRQTEGVSCTERGERDMERHTVGEGHACGRDHIAPAGEGLVGSL